GPSSAYNIPMALRLSGVVDRGALVGALRDVVQRHEPLRTVFVEGGAGPCQVVLGVDAVVSGLQVVATSRERLGGDLAAAAGCRFDLSREAPFRVWLFGLGGDEHVLLMVVHHVAADGWSMPVLAGDLARAYVARCGGAAPGWGELPVSYVDYALWQRRVLGSEEESGSLVAAQVGFWRERLAGLPVELVLPVDRVRPVVGSQGGGEVTVQVGADLHRALVGLARGCRATLFMVLQAGVVGLLSRLGAGVDVPVGTPVAGRVDVGLEGLVGFFVNSLVLRTDVSGDPSFGELVGRVREVDLAAFAHQDVPFERLVEVVNPERSLARHPLFQVM
ncbi:condensation domain-containing protein, partial [Micromonospora echinospora]|uniref:condensation domain-containing protein n=1 Tax=Micromonospora echinospora TaxID=1877 RepID=UPI003CF06356